MILVGFNFLQKSAFNSPPILLFISLISFMAWSHLSSRWTASLTICMLFFNERRDTKIRKEDKISLKAQQNLISYILLSRDI